MRQLFENFRELEIVGREWEAEMEKSSIKGQQIKIMENYGNNSIVKTMKIIMKDRIILSVNYKTHSIDHNSNQGTLTMAQDIFITTKKVKTHTHGLEIIMNS